MYDGVIREAVSKSASDMVVVSVVPGERGEG